MNALDACEETAWTSDEMMTVAASRSLRNGVTCFVGIGLPSAAANLARRTHAPGIVLVYESGPIGAKPSKLPLSIGDGELAETADVVVSIPEIFNYWLQPGRIDMGFLGAAQIDRFANINTTIIGDDYRSPQVRLPGAGGAPEIAAACGEVTVVMRHGLKAFVKEVDFVTTPGYGREQGDREKWGLRGQGPTTVITDLGVLKPDPESCELVLVATHQGICVDDVQMQTQWPLKVATELATTEAPTPDELSVLRSLTKATGTANTG